MLCPYNGLLEFTERRLESKMSLELGFAAKARLAAAWESSVRLGYGRMENGKYELEI